MPTMVVVSLGTVWAVVETIRPFIEGEVNLHLNSQEQAATLQKHLLKIQTLLDETDGFRLSKMDPDVKKSIDALHDAAGRIDDVLKQWNEARSRSSATADGHDHQGNEEVHLWQGLGLVLSCMCEFAQQRRLAKAIARLNKLVDSVYDKARKELKEALKSQDLSIQKKEIIFSTLDDEGVYGRTVDKDTIKNMLLDVSPRLGRSKIDVIAIVGEGGVGKSALARLLCNDSQVKDEFLDICIAVSQSVDQTRIAREILQALQRGTGVKIDNPGFDQLAREIDETISKRRDEKKLLLVLDDVWDDDHHKWSRIKGYLRSAAPGSKILVTTRNVKVARSLGVAESKIHRLDPLKYLACWSIIKEIALSGKDELSCKKFEVVGIVLARKCKGSPLAAHVLGKLLRDMKTVPKWKHVRDSDIWEKALRENIFYQFLISFKELKPEVKRCFKYCAVFPKNTEIDVGRLIRIWMANDLFSSTARFEDQEASSVTEMEGRGYACFDDLADHCFFQDLVKDEFGEHIVSCRMPNLVHDFAQFLAKRECRILQNTGDMKAYENKAVRHIYWDANGNQVNDAAVLSNFNAKELRSLFCVGQAFGKDLLLKLQGVQALTLAGCGMETIPDEIGTLTRLKYLDVSRNEKLTQLPEAMCSLRGLETLVLEHCPNLTGLPQGISKLENLSHISLGDEPYKYFHLPNGLEKLTNLRQLNFVYVGKGCPNKLGCLQNLNKLAGKLTILLEEPDGDVVQEAAKANLKDKESIQSLVLECDGSSVRSLNEAVELLQPHQNLQSLTLRGPPYIPNWISSLVGLRKLSIKGDIDRCSLELPSSLGQLPHLEKLWIDQCRFDFLGLASTSQGRNFDRFPSLKELRFSNCNGWKEWRDISEDEEEEVRGIKVMPNLDTLEIDHCPLLKELPHRLLEKSSCLKCIRLISCTGLKQRYEGQEHLPLASLIKMM